MKLPHLQHEAPNHFQLPHRLRRLADLAYNLWWTWTPEAGRLFLSIDPELWEATNHNPVLFLRQVRPERLQSVQKDRYFLELYDSMVQGFDSYLTAADTTWVARHRPELLDNPVAYFSTEYGLHETLPIYAGGLGVLSGDHLKEASDLGLPLVAVGFLYTQGYFTQRITEDGWQEANYASLSFQDLPVFPVRDENDRPVTVQVELPGRELTACVWRIQVGRVPLYLLDTNVGENLPEDRGLTSRLYTGDLEMRIAQEIVLGIGGVRALRNLGYNPTTWHMNEGHSAFLVLELARERVLAGRSFEQALPAISRATSFTTHTPVPAGHDEFPLTLMEKYFSRYWPQLGLDREAFMDMARHAQPWGDTFSMAILALRTSGRRNGVSELHGEVARQMWSYLWPSRPVAQVPITHITNGVHTGTWLARRLHHLFDQYFDAGWMARVDDPETWEAIDHIPDDVLWELRRHQKRKLVAYMRERIRRKWVDGVIHPVQVVASGVMLDPYALTIGFARRFATYKRADLILQEPDRLIELITRPGMPVQIIFAGKAHPADEPGKRLIQRVYRQVKRSENAGRLVFLEDYDMNLARYMVQGVDVWLNTPRRPNEASGTSGQKAAMNGAINFSVLDGWWQEAYNGTNGWAIGSSNELDDDLAQEVADAASLYKTLEEQIIPLYYIERSADGLPGEWIGKMKQSMRTCGPAFSMRRMVKEYIDKMYLPETNRALSLPAGEP